MENIFKVLEKFNITYAVTEDFVQFAAKNVIHQKENCVLLVKKDADKLKRSNTNVRFKKNKEYPDLIEYVLNEAEKKYFIQNKGKYDKIIDTIDGKLFELKNKSFKKYYKQYCRSVCNNL